MKHTRTNTLPVTEARSRVIHLCQLSFCSNNTLNRKQPSEFTDLPLFIKKRSMYEIQQFKPPRNNQVQAIGNPHVLRGEPRTRSCRPEAPYRPPAVPGHRRRSRGFAPPHAPRGSPGEPHRGDTQPGEPSVTDRSPPRPPPGAERAPQPRVPQPALTCMAATSAGRRYGVPNLRPGFCVGRGGSAHARPAAAQPAVRMRNLWARRGWVMGLCRGIVKS